MNTNLNQHIFTTERKHSLILYRGFCAVTNKILNKDLNRIGYRDMKHQFSILIDDNKLKKLFVLLKSNHNLILYMSIKRNLNLMISTL